MSAAVSRSWLATVRMCARPGDHDPGAVVVQPEKPAGPEHLHHLRVNLVADLAERVRRGPAGRGEGDRRGREEEGAESDTHDGVHSGRARTRTASPQIGLPHIGTKCSWPLWACNRPVAICCPTGVTDPGYGHESTRFGVIRDRHDLPRVFGRIAGSVREVVHRSRAGPRWPVENPSRCALLVRTPARSREQRTTSRTSTEPLAPRAAALRTGAGRPRCPWRPSWHVLVAVTDHEPVRQGPAAAGVLVIVQVHLARVGVVEEARLELRSSRWSVFGEVPLAHHRTVLRANDVGIHHCRAASDLGVKRRRPGAGRTVPTRRG